MAFVAQYPIRSDTLLTQPSWTAVPMLWMVAWCSVTELIPTGDSKPRLGSLDGSILSTFPEWPSFFFPKRVCVCRRCSLLPFSSDWRSQGELRLGSLHFSLPQDFWKKNLGKPFVTFFVKGDEWLKKEKHKSLSQRVMEHLGKMIAV